MNPITLSKKLNVEDNSSNIDDSIVQHSIIDREYFSYLKTKDRPKYILESIAREISYILSNNPNVKEHPIYGSTNPIIGIVQKVNDESGGHISLEQAINYYKTHPQDLDDTINLN